MKKLLCMLLCVLLLVPLCACGIAPQERYSATVFDCFDTVTTITAYDTERAQFDAAVAAVEAEMKRYDRLYDIYHTYDDTVNLCTLNERSGASPVAADKDILALLQYGKEAYAFTKGTVNICAGAVLSLWHTAREEERLPDMAALRTAKQHCNIDDLVLENGTVFFKDTELKLDVGALAKGFVAERLRQYIKDNALWENYIISLGGNVITAGHKPDAGNAKWNVEIENPKENAVEPLAVLAVTDTAVVTSGDYQRYFTVDGINYCHIINLDTLMPATEFRSVSVVCADAAMADALSTALFILPEKEGRELLEGMDGAEALWADSGCEISYTEGFPR